MTNSTATATATATANPRTLIWDTPVRVFHWLMVLSFAGAYITAESERWRLLHVSLGYTLGGLVAFRILWGLMGTKHARFASFVRGPAAIVRYLRSLLSAEPQHHVGHNPAGALAIVLLLLSSVAIVISGWSVYNEVGGDWLEDLHEGAANFMLALVAVHVAGVVVSSWLHRENLVRAMVTGKKDCAPGEGIRWAWRPLGLLVLLAVLGFWWLQWQSAPSFAASGGDGATAYQKSTPPARDDD